MKQMEQTKGVPRKQRTKNKTHGYDVHGKDLRRSGQARCVCVFGLDAIDSKY